MDPNRSFRIQTDQAAIIHALLYSSYPNIVNTFQERYPCPIRINTRTNHEILCPLGGTQGCQMRDRRSISRFPRDRVEKNVYKFLGLLRDEEVFNHQVLYKIFRLFPTQLSILISFSPFWIGYLYRNEHDRWIFHLEMPLGWEMPNPSDNIYE
ncbi:MAG: hypothetical protein ACTSYF_00505, partial [Promethearchaeota archaeon]